LLFEKAVLLFDKAVLLFEKGVLLFEKGVLLFEKGFCYLERGFAIWKGVLPFEKGVLLFEKGILLFEKLSVVKKSKIIRICTLKDVQYLGTLQAGQKKRIFFLEAEPGDKKFFCKPTEHFCAKSALCA
jgi:hypothetical protein